jgi:hypothetical protein
MGEAKTKQRCLIPLCVPSDTMIATKAKEQIIVPSCLVAISLVNS